MEFAVAGYLSKDGKKMVLFSSDARSVYWLLGVVAADGVAAGGSPKLL